MARTCDSLPFSFQTIFHGISVVLVLSLILGTWVLLWQIDLNTLYHGNNNKCYAGNTIGTYGEDNVLYCVHTNIVSSVQVNNTFLDTAVSFINLPASQIPIVDKQTSSITQEIYIDDDDEEIGWYYNFNPGSSIQMNFTGILEGTIMNLQIDDEDTGYTIPIGDSGYYSFTPDKLVNNLPSRGYKFSLQATPESLQGPVGYVLFEYTLTFYGAEGAAKNYTNCTPASLVPCYQELDYGEDFCILVSNRNARNYNSDYTQYCSIIFQTGRDSLWSGIIIPSATILAILIIVVNCMVVWILSRRANKYHVAVNEDQDSLYS